LSLPRVRRSECFRPVSPSEKGGRCRQHTRSRSIRSRSLARLRQGAVLRPPARGRSGALLLADVCDVARALEEAETHVGGRRGTGGARRVGDEPLGTRLGAYAPSSRGQLVRASLSAGHLRNAPAGSVRGTSGQFAPAPSVEGTRSLQALSARLGALDDPTRSTLRLGD
jgi:hypothetical protein